MRLHEIITESQTAKSGIVQTDVYGTKAYHAKCMEKGCDWESKRYDRIQQAQAAAKKHAEQHFDKKGVAEGLSDIVKGAVGGGFVGGMGGASAELFPGIPWGAPTLVGTVFGAALGAWSAKALDKPVYQVYVNGKQSSDIMGGNDAARLIAKLASKEHDTKTVFTIVNVKSGKIVFRKIWSDQIDHDIGHDQPGWRGSWDGKESVEQGVAEEINPEVKQPGFKHRIVIGDYIYSAKGSYTGLRIECHDSKGTLLGYAQFMFYRDHLESQYTKVRSQYQGQGIASNMYAYAHMLGNDIQPSPYLEPDGKKMWRAFKKSGAAKIMAGDTVKEAKMSAAVRFQRAMDRERAKTDAHYRAGEEVMARARAEQDKKKEQEKKK
jgi:hypothetical protein